MGGAAPSMCAKRALASSAALAASRGRMNTLGTDSMAAMDRISLEHLRAACSAPRSRPTGPPVQPGSLHVAFIAPIAGAPGTAICATANSHCCS